MDSIPAPRVPPCRRHHVHLVSCPDCNAWHRDHLRAEREEAAKRIEKARGWTLR